MGQNNGLDEFSGQIQRSVEAAVNSINHMVNDIKDGVQTPSGQQQRPLGQEVNQSVKSAVDEIKNQFYAVFQTTQEVNRRQAGVSMDPARYNRYAQQQQIKTEYQQRFRNTNMSQYPQQAPLRTVNGQMAQPLRVTKKAKKFPGEEKAESGTVGWIIGAILSTLIVIGCMEDGEGLLFTLMFVAAMFGCCFGLANNIRKKRQYKRFREYINRFSSQPYYSVQEIMNNFGYSQKTVLSDWREMIRLNIFPQATISPDGQMIFLSQDAFLKYQAQYMGSIAPSAVPANNRQVPLNNTVSEEQARAKERAQQMSEVEKTLAKGRQYISQIRTANEAIPGEVVSEKLNTLEDVCKRIFTVVEAHPEKLTEIRKFMDYYMPTTLKLVRTYKEFDEQKLESEQITSTKQDIEGTLDMINIAFANLLNDLYQDQAVQASADISVLSTLFAQAGLKDSDFSKMEAQPNVGNVVTPSTPQLQTYSDPFGTVLPQDQTQPPQIELKL